MGEAVGRTNIMMRGCLLAFLGFSGIVGVLQGLFFIVTTIGSGENPTFQMYLSTIVAAAFATVAALALRSDK
jgi:hypothetical protein